MSKQETGSNPAILETSLQALSGKFGEIGRESQRHLVSNDEDYGVIRPQLLDRLRGKRSGMGVFIGSGGYLSQLPDLPITSGLILDKNPVVLETSKRINSLVLQSETPNDLLDQLLDQDPNPDYLRKSIQTEASNYGLDHWSNPKRFAQTKEALKKRKTYYVAADITDEDFGPALHNTLSENGEHISFANFTNVHSWLRMRMDFLTTWPFAPDATIMYSSNEHRGIGLDLMPGLLLAKDLQDYIETSWIDW